MRDRWAVTSLALSMLLSSLGASVATVALPTLAKDFGASFQAVQWVVLAYLLAITVLIVSVGRHGDVLGHRKVLLAGIGLFTAASVLCSAAPTLLALVAARALQGLGAAILMALAIALVRDAVPKERTGAAMGLLGTVGATGTALGPSLGGILIAAFGWRAIFLLTVPLGIAAFFLAYRYLPAGASMAKDGASRFDLRGTLTTLRSPVLSSSLLTNLLVTTVMMTTMVVGPFYLTRALGLNEALVGMVMSAGPVMSALSGVPAGRIVDRKGAPFAVIAGLAAMMAGCVALTVLPALWGIGGYLAALIILTPGYQLFLAANNTAVMSDVDPGQRGAVAGLLSLSRNLGLITGASVMGAVFAFASATTDITTASPEAVTTGMRTTFAVTAVLIATATIISAAGRTLFTRRPTVSSAP